MSDSQIRLFWEKPSVGSEEVAFYRIFRSRNPQFEPDLRHLAGATGQTVFTDQPVLNYGGWTNNYVEPDTKYFYRVCPVSKYNVQGPASEIIESLTLASNKKDMVPNKVEGLHVVHVSPITNDNYLCLFFYSNIESDVTGYRIYRSRESGFIPAAGSFYYRVCAVDRAGNTGEFSDEASGKAVLNQLTIEGNRFFFSGGSAVTVKPSFTDGSEVHYTLDGSLPSRSSLLYTGPFKVTRASKLRVAIFYPGSDTPSALCEASFSTALYPAPKYNTIYAARWSGSGIYNLVDGQRGGFWNDGFWQGFEYDNLDVVVDLGKTTEISEASLGTIQFLASWIFLPVEVDFFLSADGTRFKSGGKAAGDPKLERTEDTVREYTVRFEKQPVRYIRVIAKNKATCPDWHVGAGGKAWIFADEITVR
ncbi:MAG: chitobiase/beta-hexosaminidase C-terminal domain-containing protein [Bacteroidia bacterium]|nr:chitobiase/beta-hexosaminidase C-terminal domain-containing protein [Bacteroidia bacterium]